MLTVVGVVIGLSEPELVAFIADRMPVDNPVTRQLVTAVKQRKLDKKTKKKRT